MPRQQAKTTRKRITRGPRKGQVITVYVKSGTEVKGGKGGKKRGDIQLVRGKGVNRTKGKRAGKSFLRTTNANGQKLHVYKDGTQVVVSKRKVTTRNGLRLNRSKSSLRQRRQIIRAVKAGKVRGAAVRKPKRTRKKR